MRLENMPNYPVRAGGRALRKPPSFARWMGGLVVAFVAVGLALHLVSGPDHLRVVTADALPGGAVPAERLVVTSAAQQADSVDADAGSTALAETAGAASAADLVPGTLPPTVPEPVPAVFAAGAGAANQSASGPAAAPAQSHSTQSPNKASAAVPKAPVTTAKSKPTPTPPTTAAPAPAPKATAAAASTPVAPVKPTIPPTTATPKPTTSTAAPTERWNPDDVKALIIQMWPAESVDRALQIAWRESNYRNDVYNGICCYGVFQINARSHQARLRARGLTTAALYDPKVNIEIALEIYNEQGWRPWGG